MRRTHQRPQVASQVECVCLSRPIVLPPRCVEHRVQLRAALVFTAPLVSCNALFCRMLPTAKSLRPRAALKHDVATFIETHDGDFINASVPV
jgi:hypothetical protein